MRSWSRSRSSWLLKTAAESDDLGRMDGALLLLALALSAVSFFAGHATGTRTGRAAPVWALVYGVVALFFLLAIGLSNYNDDAADAGGRAFALPLLTAFGLLLGIGFAAGTRSGARG